MRSESGAAASARIDPSSPEPKWSQLRGILLDLVADELEADRPIPSERELGDRFGLSRMTVRQAVDRLVAEGALYRVPGRGTFVARAKIVMPLRLTSFTQDMRARGLAPGAVDIGRGTVAASEVVAGSLGLAPGDPVHLVERLRTADGEPMAIERAHLPARVTPGLLDETLEDRSLYAVLQEKFGLLLDTGEQTIEAVTAAASDARLLGVSRGSPVLLLVRRSFAGDLPVEYVTSTYRGDRYQLRVSLDAPDSARRRSPGGRS